MRKANVNAMYNLNISNLSSKSIDFSKIDKSKIEEYIEMMQEHQMKCVQEGNFIEAELAKQRVNQLIKIQEKKEYNDAKKRQNQDKINFNKVKNEEIKETTKILDNKYAEEMSKLDEMMDELKQRHEKELNDYFTEFDNSYKNEMKPSNELIEKQKQLDYFVKIEDYPNAHLAQVDLEEIKKKDLEKYQREREKKIEKELSKLQYRQNTELQALELKIQNHKNTLLRERNNKLNEINLKYKNKSRALERDHKAERDSYERIINRKDDIRKLSAKYRKDAHQSEYNK